MSLPEVFMFLNDFQITQSKQIKRDDVKRIVQLINLKTISKSSHADLDINGFTDFILQLGHFSHYKSLQPSIFLPRLFKILKEVSMSSTKPLFQRLFEDPSATTIGDRALIQELTRCVNKDPEYQLPPGFIKYKGQGLIEKFNAPTGIKESETISMEILDDVCFQTVGIHSLNPQIEQGEEMWLVKADIFQVKQKKSIRAQYDKITPKYQYQPKNQQTLESNDYAEPRTKQRSIRVRKTPIGAQSHQIKSFKGRDLSVGGRSLSPSKTKFKKEPPRMESTKEPEIDVSLKILLANNAYRPDKKEFKEVVLLMEDMLQAVEKGNTELSPTAKAKINNFKELSKVKNKALASKAQQEQDARDLEKLKQKKLAKRDQDIKAKLAEFSKIQWQQKASEMAQKKKELEQQKLKEQRKEQKKKEYYNKIKRNFSEQRLPDIKSKEAETQKKVKEEKKVKQITAKEANQKVSKRIQEMKRNFEEQKLKREQEEQAKKEEEDAKQQEILDNREDMTRNRKSIVDPSLLKKQVTQVAPPTPTIQKKHTRKLDQSKIVDNIANHSYNNQNTIKNDRRKSRQASPQISEQQAQRAASNEPAKITTPPAPAPLQKQPTKKKFGLF